MIITALKAMAILCNMGIAIPALYLSHKAAQIDYQEYADAIKTFRIAALVSLVSMAAILA